MRVKVKKNNEIIKICEECDAVWLDDILEELGTTFKRYMEQRGYATVLQIFNSVLEKIKFTKGW